MKDIRLETKKLSKKEIKESRKSLMKVGAKENDCSIKENESFRLFIDGVLEAVYIADVLVDVEPLRDACSKVKVDKSGRSSGMVSKSKIFGAVPRVAVRHDRCRKADLTLKHPEIDRVFSAYGKTASSFYKKFNLEKWDFHDKTVNEVLPEWKISGTPFTSGIMNRDNPIPYHLDQGNFKDCWSAMYTLKEGVEGGNLNLPEVDFQMVLRDRSLLLFNGQGVVHGVTPFKLKHPDAHRWTVVYYSLQGLWNCDTSMGEFERYKELRTKIENKAVERGKDK